MKHIKKLQTDLTDVKLDEIGQYLKDNWNAIQASTFDSESPVGLIVTRSNKEPFIAVLPGQVYLVMTNVLMELQHRGAPLWDAASTVNDHIQSAIGLNAGIAEVLATLMDKLNHPLCTHTLHEADESELHS